jgi:lipoyl-dependent peroxiredoxin
MKRNATATWHGSGKEGNGLLSTKSTVLDNTPFSFNSRFADGKGTNPEELLAAAHAGCFSMKLSFVLAEAGFVPDAIETTAHVNFENGSIVGSHLVVKAKIAGISNEAFEASIKDAELNCPVSRALKSIEVTSEATLIN